MNKPSEQQMNGDADHDFAVKMRKHHQMALDMAKAELKNGKDSELRSMAEGIIDSQSKEIAVFDAWMAKNKATADHSPKSK